ncbi:hypothetical protein [Bradyrhizobium manausense]|uniref:hypothetical protein n=1 Tax=Bradyrhizobium manausense TaxID=989370 RepID=UPI001BA6CF2A|nr:hypothetical protein [Bradyrhizobium manausense]MBR0721756.1 hypothetical protein [Bradyrhizobium manausense]
MAIKVSRAFYAGTLAEYLVWAARVKEPYCTMLREEREITRKEASDLGYAILDARPFTADSKHFLTCLFYAIMDDPG